MNPSQDLCNKAGHSLKDVETILDTHYMSRDRGLGESAIRKLENHFTVNGTANGKVVAGERER